MSVLYFLFSTKMCLMNCCIALINMSLKINEFTDIRFCYLQVVTIFALRTYTQSITLPHILSLELDNVIPPCTGFLSGDIWSVKSHHSHVWCTSCCLVRAPAYLADDCQHKPGFQPWLLCQLSSNRMCHSLHIRQFLWQTLCWSCCPVCNDILLSKWYGWGLQEKVHHHWLSQMDNDSDWPRLSHSHHTPMWLKNFKFVCITCSHFLSYWLDFTVIVSVDFD